MAAPVLYHSWISTCSQKVRYALAYKGIEYKSRYVALDRVEHLEDWYLEINPNGVVPAMTHNGATILDSSVICEYLEEVFPGPSLSPADPVGRAHMRAWMRYLEEVPTAAIRTPSFNKLFAAWMWARGEEANARYRAKMQLRRHFYEKLGPNGFSEEQTRESVESLDACLARVESTVSKGGPFLLGDRLTIADIVLLPSIVRMEDLLMSHMWADRPSVQRWYQAMQAQPAFELAYPEGSRYDLAATKPAEQLPA